MILVEDNYLPEQDFWDLQDYCEENDFTITEVGGKKFDVLHTPNRFLEKVEIAGHVQILSFIRRAYKGFDNDPRIHSDGIIRGYHTDLASVLYINDPEGVTPNGTRFYEHEDWGTCLPDKVSPEIYDKVLEDTNDESKFKVRDSILAVPNRLLVYSASCFHAKYPNEIEEGVRMVMVTFYTKTDNLKEEE